ncbi:MAG: nitrate reductase cytochrome c-type subunit [Acidobacteriota bacterium]
MNRTILLWLAIIAAGCAGGTNGTGGVGGAATPDTEIGLSKGSVFESLSPDPVIEDQAEPGDKPLLPRAYPGSPPLISHGVADFLPISRDQNACIDCHQVELKEEGEPTPIPRSHFVDLRNAPAQVRETPAGARYNCVSCHVPQTNAGPLVAIQFGG